MKPILVILAAGIGSRYGGLKQLQPVGPNGQTILDYSVFDALRAGFGEIVFVVRPDILAEFQSRIGERIARRLPVLYALQSADSLPNGILPPPGRAKPWGTGHAVLSTAAVVDAPFAVVNADDFYGQAAIADAAGFLRGSDAQDSRDYAMIGYRLRDTLPTSGPVSRAICQCDPDGYLSDLQEVKGIERQGRAAGCTDCAGQTRLFDGDELVSMNLWALRQSLFPLLAEAFDRFLARNVRSTDAEFHLPSAISELVRSGAIRVKVLPSREAWCGVTHRQDSAAVAERIDRLIDEGVYPRELWT
jgi:hypothetical protein